MASSPGGYELSNNDQPYREVDFFIKCVAKLIANGWAAPSAINVMKSISTWTQPEQDRVVEVWAREGESYVLDTPIDDDAPVDDTHIDDIIKAATEEYLADPDGLNDPDYQKYLTQERLTQNEEFQEYLRNEYYTRPDTPPSPETPQ